MLHGENRLADEVPSIFGGNPEASSTPDPKNHGAIGELRFSDQHQHEPLR